MPVDKKPNVKDILKKHSAKIEKQMGGSDLKKVNYSRQYVTFKEEMSSEFSGYEKFCHSLGVSWDICKKIQQQRESSWP